MNVFFLLAILFGFTSCTLKRDPLDNYTPSASPPGPADTSTNNVVATKDFVVSTTRDKVDGSSLYPTDLKITREPFGDITLNRINFNISGDSDYCVYKTCYDPQLTKCNVSHKTALKVAYLLDAPTVQENAWADVQCCVNPENAINPANLCGKAISQVYHQMLDPNGNQLRRMLQGKLAQREKLQQLAIQVNRTFKSILEVISIPAKSDAQTFLLTSINHQLSLGDNLVAEILASQDYDTIKQLAYKHAARSKSTGLQLSGANASSLHTLNAASEQQLSSQSQPLFNENAILILSMSEFVLAITSLSIAVYYDQQKIKINDEIVPIKVAYQHEAVRAHLSALHTQTIASLDEANPSKAKAALDGIKANQFRSEGAFNRAIDELHASELHEQLIRLENKYARAEDLSHTGWVAGSLLGVMSLIPPILESINTVSGNPLGIATEPTLPDILQELFAKLRPLQEQIEQARLNLYP